MNNNIKSLLLVLVAVLTALPVFAQNDDDETRGQWFKELREYKHKYLSKELELTRDQEQAFFPIYDKMEDDETKINNETRALEARIRNAANVSDLEYEQATQALLEQKNKEYAVETEAFAKFKTILTHKQLFMLKGAERQFTREVMKFHHRNPRRAPQNRK